MSNSAKPKRYFADPSLGIALLGATPTTLLRDMQTLGLIFESMVIRSLNTVPWQRPRASIRRAWDT